MFQVRKSNQEYRIGKKICLPQMWKQDFLQAKNRYKKNKGNIIQMENKNEKIQEMQILEQNFHNILLQRQAFEMELSETEAALKEIEKSNEVYKLIGELMIKTDKEKVKEELSTKEKILSMRIKSIEKQEDAFTKKIRRVEK